MTDDGRSVKNINILLLFYGDDAKSIGIKYDESGIFGQERFTSRVRA